MNKTSPLVLAALLAGLMLSACEKPDSADAPSAASATDAVLLSRDLDPAQVAHGRTVYDRLCAECHGTAGRGQPGDWRVRAADGMFPPPPLDDSAHAWHHPTAVLLQVIREGSPQGQGKMPAWNGKLSEQEMQDVVAYIKSLWSDPVFQRWLEMEQQTLGG